MLNFLKISWAGFLIILATAAGVLLIHQIIQPEPEKTRVLIFSVLLIASSLSATFSFLISEYFKAWKTEKRTKRSEDIIQKEKQTEKEEETTVANKKDRELILSSLRSLLQTTIAAQPAMKQLLKVCGDYFGIVQGEVFVFKPETAKYELKTAYAYYNPEGKTTEFELGEGFAGQVAREGLPMKLSNIPENYLTIISGLGETVPASLAIIPVITSHTDPAIPKVHAIIELASFSEFSDDDLDILKEMAALLAEKLEKIKAE